MPKLKEASLDSVCFLVTDGTHDTPKRVKNGFPLIKAKEIVGGKIDFETCDQISEEEHLRVIARSKPEYGDTLFAHIGASLGEAAFVKVHHAFSIKNIALFKPNLKIIDERYLYYLVISPAFQGLAKQTKTGSAQPFLSLGHLRSHRVTYHEALNEQRKIGAILSTYDDLIENNLQRIKILDGMAQNIFREWFVKFRFPGHQHARFTDSSLGQIPEGWEVKRLGAAFLTLLGGTPSRNNPAFWRNGTIPWINSGKVNDHRVTEPSELITELALEKSAAKLMPPGTTLIAITGATLGQVSMLEIQATANQSVVGVISKDENLIEWLHLTISERIQSIINHASGGAQQHINKGIVDDVVVAVPPSNITKDFQSIALPLYRQIACLIFKNTTLRRTRDLLLPRLISGEVDVSALDIALPEEASA